MVQLHGVSIIIEHDLEPATRYHKHHYKVVSSRVKLDGTHTYAKGTNNKKGEQLKCKITTWKAD